MKNKSLLKDWITRGAISFVIACTGANFAFESNALASADLDRKYQLETIGFLKTWDNMDGLFTEYVSAVYKDYFSKQSRFVVTDLTKIDATLSLSKLAYLKVISDPEILSQIARSARIESLIRTKVTKEGSQYFFTLDWLHAPQMDLLGTQTFTIEEPRDNFPFGKDLITEPLSKNLTELIHQVPIHGQVTGRDNQSVTINLGDQAGIKKGDILVISTLDEVKKHPLLKSIVGWTFSPIGKVVVEQTEESLAFCKVISEEPGRQISRYQKITQIQSPQSADQVFSPPPQKGPEEVSQVDSSKDSPKIGWVGVTLFGGGMSRQFSSQSDNVSNSGGGMALGAKAAGELWFTRNWFSQIEFRYASSGYSQHDSNTGQDTPATQSGGVSASYSSFLLAVGYTHYLSSDLFGPKGWIKLGYKSNSYSLPASSTEATGAVSFGTIFLGLGGSVPIRGPWGALANFNFKLLSSASVNWISAPSSSVSDIELYLGGYYRFNPRVILRGGLEVIANSADFEGGYGLSQKMVTVGPSLLYYF